MVRFNKRASSPSSGSSLRERSRHLNHHLTRHPEIPPLHHRHHHHSPWAHVEWCGEICGTVV